MSSEVVEKVLKLKGEDKSLRAIRDEVGISIRQIRKILKAKEMEEIPSPKGDPKPKKVSKKVKQLTEGCGYILQLGDGAYWCLRYFPPRRIKLGSDIALVLKQCQLCKKNEAEKRKEEQSKKREREERKRSKKEKRDRDYDGPKYRTLKPWEELIIVHGASNRKKPQIRYEENHLFRVQRRRMGYKEETSSDPLADQ